MSRSRRKTPITGFTTCYSEKDDNRAWHKKYRAKIKIEISKGHEVLTEIKEISNPWLMGKDGKQYCPDWKKIWRK